MSATTSFVGTIFKRDVALLDVKADLSKAKKSQEAVKVGFSTSSVAGVINTLDEHNINQLQLTANITTDDNNNKVFNITRFNVTSNVKGKDGNTTPNDVECNVETEAVFDTEVELGSMDEYGVVTVGENAVTISSAEITTAQEAGTVVFNKLSLEFQAGAKIHFHEDDDNANIYTFNFAGQEYSDNVVTIRVNVPVNDDFTQTLQFQDNQQQIISKVNAGISVYPTRDNSENIVNFSTDAGFYIPSGTSDFKYIRIYDLAHALGIVDSEEGTLEDRVHALEVTLKDVVSSELDDSTNPEAVRLLNIKQTHQEL